MIDRGAVHEGMQVFSRDGDKLGKVSRCNTGEFEIEKGFFFPKDYLARYEDVLEVRDDGIYLALSKAELEVPIRESQAEEQYAETLPASGKIGTEASSTSGTGMRSASSTEETRIPLAEEELSVEKREREAGKVLVTKEVVTEEKEMKVPVRREKVRVERVPATEMRAAEGTEAFQEKTVSVPVHEEEVEIRKRPVVKEEVRISKGATEEERTLSAEARREKAEIRTEGDVSSGSGRGEPEK